jgi:hypothetical protein
MLATLASDHPGIGYAPGEDLAGGIAPLEMQVSVRPRLRRLRLHGRYRDRNPRDESVEGKRLA